MSKTHPKSAGLLLAALLTIGVSLTQPASAWRECYGQRTDYYSSSALVNIVGSKITCVGYPTEYDSPYTETLWFTTQQYLCPCSPGAPSACFGERYDYYSSSAQQNIVSSKVICEGFPNQYDADINGYTETPWFTVAVVSCPCPS